MRIKTRHEGSLKRGAPLNNVRGDKLSGRERDKLPVFLQGWTESNTHLLSSQWSTSLRARIVLVETVVEASSTCKRGGAEICPGENWSRGRWHCTALCQVYFHWWRHLFNRYEERAQVRRIHLWLSERGTCELNYNLYFRMGRVDRWTSRSHHHQSPVLCPLWWREAHERVRVWCWCILGFEGSSGHYIDSLGVLMLRKRLQPTDYGHLPKFLNDF